MQSIQYQKDSNNIAHLTLDKPDSEVNLVDLDFANDFAEAVDKVLSDDVEGVLIRSNKSTFFAGGDIKLLYATVDDNAHQLYAMLTQIKAAMRRLETSGKPVVACINGSALGGGLEVALCAHRRIAVNNKTTKLGFPEVNLGLLPGAGGVVRMVRLFGLQAAMPYLTQAKLLNVERALAAGLLHQLVDTQEQAIEAAIEWVKANPQASQPYDQKGYKIPGGGPNHPAMAQVLPPGIL